jgi:uncharacterized protein with ATP-grasp and redox domains
MPLYLLFLSRATLNRPIFFLLKTKCRVIADDMGVDEGDIILKAGDR